MSAGWSNVKPSIPLLLSFLQGSSMATTRLIMQRKAELPELERDNTDWASVWERSKVTFRSTTM